MNIERVYLCNEAFGTVKKQVHAWIDGQFYRIFGEGDKREIRKVISATKQPKLTGKKLINKILAAVDSKPLPPVAWF